MAEITERLIGLVHGFARFAHYKSCRRLAKGQVATVAACHRRQGRGNRVWITARQRFAEIAGVTENEQRKKKKKGKRGRDCRPWMSPPAEVSRLHSLPDRRAATVTGETAPPPLQQQQSSSWSLSRGKRL